MSEPRLHIFNPENDGALAFGKANYTPPASAWQMHLSGEAMPLWYGSAGDRFISYGINARWLDSVCGRMNIDIDVASDVEIASGNFVPCPWGWSDYARRLLYDAGYPGGSLPSDESISCWRALSNRALTVKFNSLLAGRFGIDAPVPEVVVDPERLRYLCSVSEGYIKQPWSCSGRGVMHTASVSVGEAVRRSQGAIRRQGAVMWEPALDRVCDFAMLFTCTGGTAVFEGLSMFISDPSGRYGGNVLDTQCAIEHKIFSHLECGTRQRIQTAVTAVVNELIAPYYSGPMGVDMMIYRNAAGQLAVAPCIEVNLRFTMGFPALRFAERHLADGAEGVIKVVESGSIDHTSCEWHAGTDGKMDSGCLVLSPPAAFAFVAEVSKKALKINKSCAFVGKIKLFVEKCPLKF